VIAFDPFDVRLRHPAYFVEIWSELACIAVPEVAGENQVILAFFQRCLRDIQQMDLLLCATLFEALGDIRRYRYASSAHLGC
jgi:hypothetical protein